MPSESKTNTKTTRKPITKLPKRQKDVGKQSIDISDMIIFFLIFFFDEYSYNTPYLQHCTDKKTI
jgi:hypothetical protein